jgi:hypothetical protein
MENKNKTRIEFEKFKNVIELLPAITYYRPEYRKRFDKGHFVFAWLIFGIIIYKDNGK